MYALWRLIKRIISVEGLIIHENVNNKLILFPE